MWKEERKSGKKAGGRSVGGPARKPIPPLPLSAAAAAKLTKVFRSESAKGEERENHLSVCILGMTAKHGVVTTESRQRPRREEASPLRKLL